MAARLVALSFAIALTLAGCQGSPTVAGTGKWVGKECTVVDSDGVHMGVLAKVDAEWVVLVPIPKRFVTYDSSIKVVNVGELWIARSSVKTIQFGL